jgi:hypothetical protein
MPLGSVDDYNITRGEINQTIYRKFITSNSRDARLVKGVEIGPYRTNTKLSQGEIEWFNEQAFLKDHHSRPVTIRRRIATQRITGVDERLRIVATIIEPPAYFADSTNSVSLNGQSPYSLEYLLALLNSPFFQWRFRITSTNNNVGTNELETMPFRRIDFSNNTDKSRYIDIVNSVQQILKAQEKLVSATSTADRARYVSISNQIKGRIDQHVADLYQLERFERQPWNEWAPLPTSPRARRRTGTA